MDKAKTNHSIVAADASLVAIDKIGTSFDQQLHEVGIGDEFSRLVVVAIVVALRTHATLMRPNAATGLMDC